GIMSLGDEVDDTELSLEEMKMAVEEAHSKHMTVCAHAEGRLGIHYAVVAGVDSVEHGFYLDDNDLALMKKQGTFLSPTLTAGRTIVVHGKDVVPEFSYRKMCAVVDDFYNHVGHAIKECDVYFDINHQNEILNAVRIAFEQNMLIVGFNNTLHQPKYVADKAIFAPDDVKKMRELVENSLSNRDVMKANIDYQRKMAGDISIDEFKKTFEKSTK